MKATEILDNLKKALSPNQEVELSNEEVKDVEVKAEEVVLADEVVEEVKEEAVVEQPSYATLSDLTSLKNEILDMLAAFAEVSKEYKKEVPSELKEEVKEEEVELSVETVEEIVPSPEANIEKKKITKTNNRRVLSTQDKVFAKLFK
jgi:hypothetical protein